MFCSVGNGGSMKKVICALVALGVSGSAMAWGDREQGALVGAVIGAVIAKESTRQDMYRNEVVYDRMCQGFVQPQVSRVVCVDQPHVDTQGRVVMIRQCSVRH